MEAVIMGVDEHIAALDRDGRLLVGAARSAGLEAPVPSCPGWVVRDLLAHIGFVHRWAAGYVQTGRTEMVEEPDEPGLLAAAPPDDLLIDWVADGHASLVGALSSAPAGLRCWTFFGAPSSLAFWARRQAHETAVHRVDAELATGAAPSPIAIPFAADGVDELLLGFLARPGSRRYAKVQPGSVSFAATDTDASWTVAVSGTGIEMARSAGTGDLSVRAPAADLYLLLWNRRPSDGLDVEGRADLLEDWRKLFRITWS
jgi:uncharacterized protein (TIGR03083 family)